MGRRKSGSHPVLFLLMFLRFIYHICRFEGFTFFFLFFLNFVSNFVSKKDFKFLSREFTNIGMCPSLVEHFIRESHMISSQAEGYFISDISDNGPLIVGAIVKSCFVTKKPYTIQYRLNYEAS